MCAGLFTFFAQINLAQAITIIDTGSPETTGSGGIGVASTQWMGLGVSFDRNYVLTDIMSWFYTSHNDMGGTLTAVLYGDDNGLPGTELFAQDFSIPDPNPDNHIKGWFGVSGLDWNVSSDDYWITYEVRNGQTFSGSLEYPAPILYPAVHYSSFSPPGTGWTILDGHGFGLVIEGNAVPIPASLWLFGSGLLGLVGMARRKKV